MPDQTPDQTPAEMRESRGGPSDDTLVRVRLAKTDCRIALTSLSRAETELAKLAGEPEMTEYATLWGIYVRTVEIKLAELVRWARATEDALTGVGAGQ